MMKTQLLAFFILLVNCQIEKKDGDMTLLAKRKNVKDKKNKKNKKNGNKGSSYNYAKPPPKIPFAPEPVYNQPANRPKPEPTPSYYPTSDPSKKPTRQLGCWHCDAPSMAECQRIGVYKTCPHNAQSCMIETRKRNGVMEQVCMGCKEFAACKANRRQNFIRGRFGQCRPDRPNGPSVCRQCCLTDECTRYFNPDDYLGWLKGPN